MKEKLKELFQTDRPVIGMIHVQALPGTPHHYLSTKEIIAAALTEAHIYKEAGIDGIAIENMHDTPYLNRKVGPEITALMSVVGYAIKQATELPCGIQILAGANQEAMAAALAAELDFVRAEGFVFAHTADEGLMQSDAGRLLRYRRQIGATHIPILTDIKKKHSSHALTADVGIVETARAAAFFQSDGLIITGLSTGEKADPDEIMAVKSAVNIPVWIGSGVTLENLGTYLPICDGMIVGSWFKEGGHWANRLDKERIQVFMDHVSAIRSNSH